MCAASRPWLQPFPTGRRRRHAFCALRGKNRAGASIACSQTQGSAPYRSLHPGLLCAATFGAWRMFGFRGANLFGQRRRAQGFVPGRASQEPSPGHPSIFPGSRRGPPLCRPYRAESLGGAQTQGPTPSDCSALGWAVCVAPSGAYRNHARRWTNTKALWPCAHVKNKRN